MPRRLCHIVRAAKHGEKGLTQGNRIAAVDLPGVEGLAVRIRQLLHLKVLHESWDLWCIQHPAGHLKLVTVP